MMQQQQRFLMTILLAVSAVMVTDAWTTGSAVSSFGGSVLVTSSRPSETCDNTLVMKKGKPNVPIQMRGNYKKQKEMAAMREQMMANSKPGSDGLPVFNLYVRTKRANMWYPCGSFKGDDRSAALCKSYADQGLLAGISKNQLDQGIAGSLYRDLERLNESVSRAYPQLRKAAKAMTSGGEANGAAGGEPKDGLEYGYKLAFDGLSEEQAAEIIVVEPKESKGWFDNVKSIFNN